MVTLSPGKTFSTDQPRLLIENALDPGRHLFRLTVVDDSGNESLPVDLVVSVAKDVVVSPPVTPTPTVPPTRVSIDPTILQAATTIRTATVQPTVATTVKTATVQPAATTVKPVTINPAILRATTLIKPK